MSKNLVRPTWVAVIVAVILLVVTSPGIAAEPAEMNAADCDLSGATIPQCCLMSDGPLSHCILIGSDDITVLRTSYSSPHKIVYLACSRTNAAAETSLNPKKPLQRAPARELPSHCYAEHHCRNSLNSEEPPQA
ncbi:hypothetical protein ACFLYB_02430 [Chloroflexota bacterium]